MAVSTSNVSTSNAAAQAVAKRQGSLALLAVGLSFMIGNLDMTVVNVATVSIQRDLVATVSGVGWVVNGYVLTMAALLLLAGDLAARLGARRIYVIGVVAFTAASVLAGLAPSIGALIAARLVQGASAALFQPASLILLKAAFPDPLVRSRMVGLWAAMGASAAGLGPVIGGVVVGTLGWRWVFWINLPIGILTVLLAVKFLPAAVTAPNRVIKPLGHLLVVLILGPLAYALMEGPDQGRSASAVRAAIAVSVIAAIAFLGWQSRTDSPIYPSRLFKNRSFTSANAIGTLMNLGLFGGVFVLALLLQTTRGASPMQAGVQLLPIMAVFVIGNVLFSRLVAKTGTRRPIILGMSVAAVATAVLAFTLQADTHYWVIAATLAVANFGLGVASPAMTATLIGSVSGPDTGTAGAMLNVNRQVGSLVGVATMVGLLTTSADWYHGARIAFLIAAAAYVLAVGAAVALPLPHPAGGVPAQKRTSA